MIAFYDARQYGTYTTCSCTLACCDCAKYTSYCRTPLGDPVCRVPMLELKSPKLDNKKFWVNKKNWRNKY